MRWIDVSPNSWYYRDVVESSRMYMTSDWDEMQTLFNSIPYNRFKSDRGRIVRSYISTESQIEFDLPGYVPSNDNPVFCYVDGVPVRVDAERDKVFLPNPISAGLEVVVMAMGVPDLINKGCQDTPTTIHNGIYPSIPLMHKDKYVFDVNYRLNEHATAMGRKLKRIILEVFPGESIQAAMRRQVGYERNIFTVVKGVMYTSFELWNIPINIEYNYKGAEDEILHTREKVIPTSEIVVWNDRFFPEVILQKMEFMVLLQRLRINLYNRYTDRTYVSTYTNERGIPDIPAGAWYEEDLYDILNEKYIDGCYVFPLYEDGTFNPEACITRAEAATYLHRFYEWAIERFR